MKKFVIPAIAFLAAFVLFAVPISFASGEQVDITPSEEQATTAAQDATVQLSEDSDAACIDGVLFAMDSFSRAQVGSNKSKDDTYVGYSFYVGSEPGRLALVKVDGRVIVHLTESSAESAGFNLDNESDIEHLKALLIALDNQNSKGGAPLRADDTWVFTQDSTYSTKNVTVKFDMALKSGQYYTVITGINGEDVSDRHKSNFANIEYADSCRLAPASEIEVIPENTGCAAIAEFFRGIDFSPLWITLKTSLTAIVFVFFLGLIAAYFCLHLPSRAQDVADSIFTIPMVLPPTVCGFLLLLMFSRNTAIGQWFIDIGFPLVFSWQATVLAAVVVSFPLMYRSARGAFESLDPDMLDAARTLGWSEFKIFFKLMLPLSWSSIAAGTVLAFARALGEFGATLFLAGNYLGITRTIPIAIYFEWMNGNMTVAIFWTVVIIIFSFIVILFINWWSKRATKYRKKSNS